MTAVFEDREGDLWVGSAGGIERIRDSAFMTYSPSSPSGGLRWENNGPVYVDTDNRTWFAPSDGGLFWLRGEQIGQITSAGLDKDVVCSIAGGPGELWVASAENDKEHCRLGDQVGRFLKVSALSGSLQPYRAVSCSH